jgi:hypothetical protein
MSLFLKIIRILFIFFLVVFLTAITQIGGVILLICLPIFSFIKKRIHQKWLYRTANLLTFLLIYLTTTFMIVPHIAKVFGKVPLPIMNHKNVKPTNILYCIMNRHYVKPQLKKMTENVANQLTKSYPNAEIRYMDGSFPIGKFRLLPHFDHSKGESLDVALFYKNSDGKHTNLKTSTSGYGVFVEPQKGERNRPYECQCEGYWQYSFTEYLTFGKNPLTFDKEITHQMVQLFAREKHLRYMLLEPHVRERMGYDSKKFRLQHCRAVRHDDHLHIRI